MNQSCSLQLPACNFFLTCTKFLYMFPKKILSVFCAFLFLIQSSAQTNMNKYDKAWHKIDSLINKKGLTETALKEVGKLYEMAKLEKREAQQIKALLYQMALKQEKEEDAVIKNIRQIEKEISLVNGAAKAILNSIAAEIYWTYFQENRYRLYDRTETIDFKKTDISTWSAGDFHKKISQLYLASLKDEKLLQQTKLEPYDPIILKGNVRHLRPTLFDLLAHRALEYFKNDERDINKPAYAFEIDKASAFDPAADFITRKFPTKDSASLHHKAILLYQRLIAFHIADKKPDALIDADLDRLEFVNSHAVIDNKNELYRISLQHIAQQYQSHPAAAQAWFLLARDYYSNAEENNKPEDILKAKDILDKIVAQKDSSEGKINAQNLLNLVLRKELTVKAEKVNLPNQPFRMLFEYRNLDQAYIRLIALDQKKKKDLSQKNMWEDDYWKELLQWSSLKNYSQALPLPVDYRLHRAEVKMDALPVGDYALLLSTDKDFSLKANNLAIQFFQVSAIAYMNHGNNFFVVHRDSGKPLSRANIQVWYAYYDYASQRRAERKGENLFTDKNGFFKISPPQTAGNSNYRLEITHGEDRLFLDDENYSAYYQGIVPAEPESIRSFLFTDRSIYRPGQVVYFKGIRVSRDGSGKSSVVPNTKTQLSLVDANGQKIDSLELTSNEFGSYSGKFNLPSNSLNGMFYIQDAEGNGMVNFSVEEYKRPKFSVEIPKPSGTYRVNDSVTLTGNAKAYAGNNIDGAIVKYRVTRKTRWPIWYDYYRRGKIWPPYSGEEQEIAYGETKTDAKGVFIIKFKALPDAKVDKKDQPIFYYEVSADITDINGETRSGSTSVAVAYQSLQLAINTPAELPMGSFKHLQIRSTNMNDLFEKTTVAVTIHRLQQPDRLFRERYWEEPDQFLYSETEYRQLFPYDVYKNENLPANWKKEKKLTELVDTTSENEKFKINSAELKAGWYLVEVSAKDKYGETVKAIKTIHLTAKENTHPFFFGSVESEKLQFEPGEKAVYELRTNLDSAWILHHINRPDQKMDERFVSLSNATQPFEISIGEADRGGIALDISFVKHNRVFTDSKILQVPFTNKQLNISYETYRDKTLPGAEEKWKVKISGYKTDKVSAEILMAMYDASLDQFLPHNWVTPAIWYKATSANLYGGDAGFNSVQSNEKSSPGEIFSLIKIYDELLSTIRNTMTARVRAIKNVRIASDQRGMPEVNYKVNSQLPAPSASEQTKLAETKIAKDEEVTGLKNPNPSTNPIQIRRNFNETAFFFPDLKTDSTGNIEFSFTMPEALTQWKWMSLAHTKELAFGYSEKTIVTQKDLMVQPNAPRFFREGDRMDFTTKIVNLTDKELTGQVELQLIDPSTNQPVDGWFRNFFPNQYFTAAAGQSALASFTIEIPFQYNKPVNYRIIARSGNISDAEEMMLPVVSNRMLVTESLPLNMRGAGTKQFKFEKLLQSGNSETIHHHALTVEFSANPAWYAVQALPYMMEYPYECSEQIFNRYYANALAATVANANPRIKAIFDRWIADAKTTAKAGALESALEKNQELKSVLLQETPWVFQANNEKQQKKNIALLFDMLRMSREMESNLHKLIELQSENGGFVWFKGGPDDRYITQYILTGIGHLKKLNALPKNPKIDLLVKKAVSYLDKKVNSDYERLLKSKTGTTQIGSYEIQYLYMRSFFTDIDVPGDVFKAYNHYRKLSQQQWVKQSRYMQGMIALSLFRTGDIQTAKDILKSIQQNAFTSEEMGMYWKEFNSGGYYWYQSPIESHALLTEAFAEISKDQKIVDDLKTWLLKQKQTQHWKSTKATAEAVYVLLMDGNNWLAEEPKVEIRLGDVSVLSASDAEAGTGYFKKIIEGKKVNPSMGNINVSVSSAGQTQLSSCGAAYWQYFEDLDKITPSSTPLKLVKKLFIERNTDRGAVLEPLKDGDALKVGDKVKVRIELRVDRTLEYVHMKDMRASALEPVNVISQYKWQGGLGYYESTKDASTNFFFGYLPKGTWVFEYPLFVTHTGTFSNGVTTIQCMYAPEFTSHSEGVKIRVE